MNRMLSPRKGFLGIILASLLLFVVAGLALAAPTEQGMAPRTPHVVAIVGGRGATLYEVPGGSVIDTLVVGARLNLQARSEDGNWVFGETVDGVSGWVETSRLLVLGLPRLPVQKATPAPTPPPTTTPEATGPAPETSTPAPTAAETTLEPTPAPTPTPFVPPEGPTSLAIARLGGATLWSDAGLEITRLKAGSHLDAAYRTPDNAYYFVFNAAGAHGWAAAEELIVVGGSELPVKEATIRPGAAVTATVNEINAFLRVRTGPSTEFPILIKVRPGDSFNVLGRNPAGDWLKIALTDAPAEAGWVAAAYVTTSAPIETLPVVEQ